MKDYVSPLALDGWVEFNRIRWGVKPVRLNLRADDGGLPAIEATLFLNKQNKIFFTPINPYSAIEFHPKPSTAHSQSYSQWLGSSEQLIKEIVGFGIANALILPPGISDTRPWQWAGFRATVNYTFCTDFPYDPKRIKSATKSNINKAIRAGYTCTRATDMKHVYNCLKDTEGRQGFDYKIAVKDLELARDLLGDENFRPYVCYSPSGEPVSTHVVLHQNGAHAIDLMAGIKNEYLKTGANQLTIKYLLDDLQQAGASGFDFTGANLPSVAEAKARWGGELKPFYIIEPYSLRGLARWLKEWRSFSMHCKGK